MKRYCLILALIATLPLLQACNNFGKEKTFNGVELFHTPAVTDAQADSLGTFLVNSKFADGTAKTVQITKSGNTYQFRFVVKEGMENDPKIIKAFKIFAASISSGVFNGAPVEIDVCDKYLKTIKVFPYEDFGKARDYKGVQLYHTKTVTDSEADSLGSYLVSSGFADGNAKTVQLNKSGSTFQFRFVVKEGLDKDTAFMQNVKTFTGQLSNKVFNGAPVEIHLCDDYMNTMVVVPMQNK
jgi:hypothetical protein